MAPPTRFEREQSSGSKTFLKPEGCSKRLLWAGSCWKRPRAHSARRGRAGCGQPCSGSSGRCGPCVGLGAPPEAVGTGGTAWWGLGIPWEMVLWGQLLSHPTRHHLVHHAAQPHVPHPTAPHPTAPHGPTLPSPHPLPLPHMQILLFTAEEQRSPTPLRATEAHPGRAGL